MPPKKKDAEKKAGEEDEEPLEEEKELLEKELVISYLKMKLVACAPAASFCVLSSDATRDVRPAMQLRRQAGVTSGGWCKARAQTQLGRARRFHSSCLY